MLHLMVLNVCKLPCILKSIGWNREWVSRLDFGCVSVSGTKRWVIINTLYLRIWWMKITHRKCCARAIIQVQNRSWSCSVVVNVFFVCGYLILSYTMLYDFISYSCYFSRWTCLCLCFFSSSLVHVIFNAIFASQ